MKFEDRILREITPLTEGDCFLVFTRKKKNFLFPLHFHPEYELNFIENGKGAKRIVGDHIGYAEDLELVMTGPNLCHTWEQGHCTSDDIYEITIQFHRDLFNESFLKRNVMKSLKELLEVSQKGISFSRHTIEIIRPRLEALTMKKGIDSYIELFSILYDLSTSRNQKLLSTVQVKLDDFFNSDKIKTVYDYIEKNYKSRIKVEDVAKLLNMTTISFSRMIKLRTGKTFIDFLNDYRIGHSTRRLLDSTLSVSEIAFDCGFNNQANFNRIFRKRKGCSPTEFRESYAGIKRIN